VAQQSDEWLEQRRQELGLDQPLPIRYLKWLGAVVQGDLGYSVVTRQPIAEELRLRLPATLQLMGAALFIGLVVGIPLGVISAIKQYSIIDYVLTAFTVFMIATPSFFLGLLAIYIFGVTFNLLPTSGMYTLGAPFSVRDRLEHLILPASILGLANAAIIMRYSRSSMVEVLQQDFIRTATAKGLRQRHIVIFHALRNALVPVITIVGLLLPELVAGAVITEQIFAWPGMGLMAVRAAADRDPSMMMGVILVVGAGVLLSNIIADFAYTLADPRIRQT
jgi:peptide/nickel transport system permease protein